MFLEQPLVASTPFAQINQSKKEAPLLVVGYKSALICYELTNTSPGEE
jgi:hypothetical protein